MTKSKHSAAIYRCSTSLFVCLHTNVVCQRRTKDPQATNITNTQRQPEELPEESTGEEENREKNLKVKLEEVGVESEAQAVITFALYTDTPNLDESERS